MYVILQLSCQSSKVVDDEYYITSALNISASVYLHLVTYYSWALMKPPMILYMALNELE